ncbi:putative long-chain-alcohol O-fatty-acyltransferase 1 [Tetrabaena socialis]|uniref:Putative long-chain-alcohol O-fatty-acyltransferase 1 n=1 Tax=Tetrabaena socialis TaxID=47790 RepID=A0A2J7ZNL6_9CHLO|nr:putative long-chain-alcohol O-fatty-acyltransferase 1 [Tetrabaena socialis]|eukprot:PNH01863.1 putative long-chain-alcohol O-fatty-acyltransferase 1 [Tetrabaena socialis]
MSMRKELQALQALRASQIAELLPPVLGRLALLYAYAAIVALWAALLVRRLRPGWLRFLAALPVVVGNLLVPLVLDHEQEPLLITPLAGVFSLAAFKLLALSIGRGPLAPAWLTPLQFAGVFLLPTIPIQVFTVGPQDVARLHTVKHGGQLLLDSWASMGGARVAMLVSWVLALPRIPVMGRHWLYTLASATFLTGAFDLLAAFAHMALGIHSAPTFDKPWLSSSFQDFWARRWNLTTTYMMRVLVYEPVMEGRLLPYRVGRGGRAAPEAQAAVGTEAEAEAAGSSTAREVQGNRAPAGPVEQEPPGAAGGGGGLKAADAPAAEAAAEAAAEGVPHADTAAVMGGGMRQRRGVAQAAPASTEEAAGGGGAPPAVDGEGGGDGSAVQKQRQPRASKLRTFLALQAVFLFSGLWHILIFW